MKLTINVLTAWGSVLLLLLSAIIWALRIGVKNNWIKKGTALSRWHRHLRKQHKLIGIAFCIVAFIHGVCSSQKVASLNLGTVCFLLGVVLGLMCMIKKYMPRKVWINFHRVLTLAVLTLTILHLADVGWLPASSRLWRQITSSQVIEETAPEETLPEEIKPEEQKTYKDGVYTGVADGYGFDLTVEVTIWNDQIEKIEIIAHNEHGENYYLPAMEQIPQAIVAAQSTDVDSVSGATYTSIGIKNATLDALKKAAITDDLQMEEEALMPERQKRQRGQH